MTYIYDFLIKKHNGQYIVMFYDDDIVQVISEIQKYCKKYAFSYKEKGVTYSCSTLVLRKRTPAGRIIRDWAYHEIFDVFTNRPTMPIEEIKSITES